MLRGVFGFGFGVRLVAALAATASFTLFAPGSAPPPGPESAGAAPVPFGFEESVIFSGLTQPMVVRFANDGRVFVAEKQGVIKVFDNVLDTTPTVFADLRTQTYDFWDRGFLGMALDRSFPTQPYIYVLYTYDHELGSSAPVPRWGDTCPSPPGPTSEGCVTSARLSRLQANGNVMTGSEQVLVEDWCGQYPSHTIGTVEHGPDGALYAGGGDGASFTFVDYGQRGTPLNPCGDPPGGVGATLSPPTAEGGALRAQDLRTSGDPVTLDGSIIRVDPATGAALPTNPLASNPDPNARRIIAHGLRNPFRFTFRPGTNEIWIGDVGWMEWEEINRILSPSDAVVENFGWPCYEGNQRQSGYDAADLAICENLYASPNADTKPFFAYHHNSRVVPGESCPVGSSSISGLSFEFAAVNHNYPDTYQGALFFSDYSRDCIWAMKKAGNPVPSPGSIDTFFVDAANPVNLEFGLDGYLYYADFDGGTIRRIHYNTAITTGTHYLSDLNWTSMVNGFGFVQRDRSFDGRMLSLNGTTYQKGLGMHSVADVRYFLGARCARLKASVGVDDEVGADGSVTFEVYADANKVYDSGVMNGASATQTVDVSVASANELRMVVTNGGDNLDSDHADWAAARVECGGGGGDTTPPTVESHTPGSGATGVSISVSPSATFSEAMDATTITASTFTLTRQGVPVAASVSYDAASRTATLDPSASLVGGTSYTLTVKGGGSGVKDAARNPLASDASWSFTTSGSGPPPAGTSYLSDLDWTSMTNPFRPLQKDRTFDLRTLTLNGVTYPKGLGAHAASEVVYSLAGTCTRFNADVGVDDEVGADGSVTFEVYADANRVYDSGVMNGASATQTVDVSVASANELRLVVTNGGDNLDSDHADWAAARVECGGAPPGGGGLFGAPTKYATGTNAHGVAIADLNGDSRLDLVVANTGPDNVSVLLGNGSGGFGSPTNFATGTDPKSVTVADVSGDGLLDLVTADQGSNTVSVLLGNGLGSYAARQSYAACSATHEIAIADFNADGRRDLAAACWNGSVISVLLGTGSGNFGNATNITVGGMPTSLVANDFNGDARQDLAIANYASNTVGILIGRGDGTFDAMVGHAVGACPHSIRSSLLNGDADPDIVTANECDDNVSVLLGAAGGGFAQRVNYSTGRAPKGIGVGDLNGDGARDVVTANTAGNYPSGASNPGGDQVSVLLGNGSGGLGGATNYLVGHTPFAVAIGQLDGRNGPDLVTANWFSHDAAVLLNGGSTGDTTPPTVTATTPSSGATGVSISVSPTGTFSEAIDATTVTTTTFTLVRQGQSTPLTASVSYDATTGVATLTPSSSLLASTAYVATLKGGSAGIKDVAGNALASDVSWSFTTGAATNTPPVPVITTPASTLTWAVADSISFAGGATDAESGTLPPSALSWTLLIQHCPSNCHSHTMQTWPGVATGSFNAPDHEYPSYLELRLTATDSQGGSASTTVRLDPKTVDLTFASSPTGLQLSVNGATGTAPFTRTVIVGSTNSVSAITPQTLAGTTYEFSSWSDTGAQTHNIVAQAGAATYTATYVIAPPRNTVLPSISGQTRVGRTLTVSNGTWTGSQPMTFTYQWLRCSTTALSSCTAISSATAKTYVATVADVDFRLRARVTATNAGGTATATSTATARIRTS